MRGEGKFGAVARRLSATLAVAVLGLCPASGEAPAPPPYDLLGTEENPNLYQRMGRSEFACLAEVVEVGHYARFRAVEVYAGQVYDPEFEIMYRGMSWGRRVENLSRIRFEKGDRYLLFLRYYREHDKPVRADLFELQDGAWGQLRLSGESESLYVQAMRLLIGAATRPEIRDRQAVLIGLIGSPNQLAAGAAMAMVASTGIAGIDEIPVLLGQMDRGIIGLKLGALRILRKMGPTFPATLDVATVAEAVHRRVGWSGEDPVDVRVEAVRTLMAMGSAAVRQLERVSQADADQGVRYMAAVWVLDHPG